MGNEIFYCTRCGVQVSGGDFGGDRSHCPTCLGIPEKVAQARRESSKRIRKPSSATMVAVAVRPAPPVVTPPRRSPALLLAGLALTGALLFAMTLRPRPADPVPVPEPRVAPPPIVLQPPPPPPVEPPRPVEEPREAPQRAPLPPPADPDLEARADACYESIEEAAVALADEGRFDDALARIRGFPEEFRRARAWNSLEGLRRQIERRARER